MVDTPCRTREDFTISLGSTYSQASDTSHDFITEIGNNLQLHETAPLLSKGTDTECLSPLQSWRAVITAIKGPKRLWSTVLISILAAVVAILSGYTLGYPSSALLALRNITDDRGFVQGSPIENLFGAMAPIGGLVGGAVAGWFADNLGRKITLILTVIPNIIGWTLIGVSWWIYNVAAFRAVILLGRFISGVGMGWSMLIAPMYIAEISIPVMRGLFSSLPQLSLAFGILLVYCIGSVPEIGYFRTAFVGAIIGSILPCLSLIVPETPRYLISKGKRQKTMSVLKWLYGPNVDLSLELIELDKILYKQRKLSVREYCAELTRKNVFVPFIMLLFVMIFQQLCGINAIIFYGAPIFKEAGIIRSEFIALLAIGITEVLTTTASALIVDLFGRKLMLLLSSSVMTVSCIGLGIHLYFCHHDMHVYTSDTIPLAIVSVIMTIVGYSLGYGAIPWTLITELLPLNVRGSLGSVLAAVNWTVTAVVTGFYLSYADLLGPGVAWWSFAAVNALAVIFVALFLPETKGQQLETIQNQMTTKFKLCA